jgi:hypothetical protein
VGGGSARRPAGHNGRMGEIGIDWASADVVDGRLTVAFSQKPPKEWRKRLEAVLERLPRAGGGWAEIKVKKRRLRVDAVQPGAEADLYHYLDSALLQANAGDGAEDEEPASPRSQRDAALTEAFRAFADR